MSSDWIRPRVVIRWQHTKATTGCCIALVMFVAGVAAAGCGRQSDVEAEIASLVAKYAESVNRADTKIAAEVWATGPDVTFIHPLGYEHGWEEVRTHVYEQLMGATFSTRKLTIRNLVVHSTPSAAFAEFQWDFAATLKKDGAPQAASGRETQVYQYIDGRWRLVHVHFSGTPTAGAEPSTPSADFINKAWRVKSSSSGSPGSLYMFLADGTLVMAGPNSVPAIGTWKRDGAGLMMIEDSIQYRVEILGLSPGEFRIRSHNPGEPVDILLVPANAGTPR
jgi:ketosteroid isomerase-like protein